MTKFGHTYIVTSVTHLYSNYARPGLDISVDVTPGANVNHLPGGKFQVGSLLGRVKNEILTDATYSCITTN